MYESIVSYLQGLQLGSNTALNYAQALAIFVGLNIVLKIIQVVIVARLRKLAQKTKTDFDDVIIEIFNTVRPPFYVLVSLYFSVQVLAVPEWAARVVYVGFVLVIVYEVIRALGRLVDFFIDNYVSRAAENGDVQQAQTMANAASIILKVTIWVLGLAVALSNMGVDITSLIASLGIGGIAIALALQNVLSDVFSSFSIYADKPFRVGDFIIVGTDKGTVEQIGLKSTRIRTLQGEQLVISNRELTSARVQNFQKLDRRRHSFMLGVTYDTSLENLKKIPTMIGEIINGTDMCELDRSHFASYGDFSLNFETVFYFDSAEYALFMDAMQSINLQIFEKFAAEKIEFAFPTQTIQLQK